MGTNVIFVFSGQANRGGVRSGSGSVQRMTLADADAVAQKCPSVETVCPEESTNAQVKFGHNNTSTSILGEIPDFLTVRDFHIQEGRFITERDLRAMARVAVIGPTTAQTLFGDASPIGQTVRIQGISFTIIGLFVSKGAGGMGDADDQVVIPLTTAMTRLMSTRYIRSMSVQARGMNLVDQATDEITQLLRKRHHIMQGTDDDFMIRSQAEIMQMADTMSATLTLLLGGIALVSLIVGGIGIMNIMLVSVTERTREIGIRMALGARRNDILWQFLVEAMVLSVLGGLIGIALGVLGSWVVTQINKWTLDFPPFST